MDKENYKFFQNKKCEFFPCHSLCDEINCLLCFCPLYHYEDCGGNFVILKNGLKDCSGCCLPHSKKGYEYVINFIKEKNKIKL